MNQLQPTIQRLKRHLFVTLLAISLTITVLLGSGFPSYSQTPRDEVIQDIKESAALDVKNESPMQTDVVLEAFEENKAGLSKQEILKIYKAEYTKLKAEYDTDFWEQARPQAGWIVAALVTVLAIFKETLSNWVTNAFEAIGEGIYAKLAGTPLFRVIALRRYRKALFEKYKELNIPFRANRPLNMEDVYIPLQAEDADSTTQVDAYGAISRHKRLMVTGPPGGGKSMLLRYIASNYGAGRLDLPGQPIPVLIELHRLSNPDLTQKELIQVIVEAFSRDNFPKAGRFVRRSLEGPLMLLLDGLDEVNSDARPKVVQQIKDLLDTYENCRVVITCRTAVYREEFATATDQTLKVAEFSDQQIRRFLKAWEPEMPPDKSIDQLLQTLRDRPRIVELARNPLLLTIIAHLYSDPSFVLPYSRTEFYQKSTGILLEQWDQWRQTFNKHKAINKRRILQHLALFNQTGATQDQKDRRRMDHYMVLEEIKKLLPGLNVDPNENTESILKEIVERSGLLQVVDGGEGYKFSHLTLQEYFVAEALKDDADMLTLQFRQAPDEWREVVKLWCGFERDSTNLIKAIYDIDAITGFECLADAQEVAPGLADSIIDSFKAKLGTAENQEQITSAFGAVAADVRPRGKAVFEFLSQALGSLEETTNYQSLTTHISHQKAVANALSKTNLPLAADVLGKYYLRLLPICDSLVKMGDLAVGVLGSLATRHSTALKDLFTIGTPDAARALTRFLWDSNQDKQQNAAWYLTSLLSQPGMEEALRLGAEDVQKTIGNSIRANNYNDSLNWIWQPFSEPADSILPVVIHQIANCITTSHAEVIPTPLPDLDPRLVVPLCTIHLQDQIILPQAWPLKAETLLEQRTQTDLVDEQIKQTSNDMLKNNSADSRWRLLLSGLKPQLQLDLLHRLIVYPPPTRNDWRDIFNEVKYDFRTGWHYICVLIIAAIASILAIIGMGKIAFQQPDSIITGFLGLALIVILTFWNTLRLGIESSFEPGTFLRFGPAGLITYGIELRQLFQSKLIWPGIEPIYKSVVDAFAVAGSVAFAVAFAGSFAGSFAGAVVVAVAVAFAFAFAVAVAFAFAVAVAGAFAFAVAVAGAFAFAVAGAGAGAFAFAVAGAVAGAGAGAVAGAVAGAGLGAWYRLKSRPEQQQFKYLAILAFPWFCWFPIVIIFGTLCLHDVFSLPWLWTVLTTILTLGLCKGLWWRGQQLENKARNPLRGGILQAELEALRGTPARHS
ncbi:MAG: NACHT domain-containing protein [Cyanobacteria bacterium P01_F01_bin.86]